MLVQKILIASRQIRPSINLYSPQRSLNLFKETDKQFEDRAFGMLIFLMFAPKEYTYDICGDEEGKPILFGQGVTEFLTWYGNPEKYEQERLPVIAEGVAENLGKLISIFGMWLNTPLDRHLN